VVDEYYGYMRFNLYVSRIELFLDNGGLQLSVYEGGQRLLADSVSVQISFGSVIF